MSEEYANGMYDGTTDTRIITRTPNFLDWICGICLDKKPDRLFLSCGGKQTRCNDCLTKQLQENDVNPSSSTCHFCRQHQCVNDGYIEQERREMRLNASTVRDTMNIEYKGGKRVMPSLGAVILVKDKELSDQKTIIQEIRQEVQQLQKEKRKYERAAKYIRLAAGALPGAGWGSPDDDSNAI